MRYDGIWLLVAKSGATAPAASGERAVMSVGWQIKDIKQADAAFKAKGAKTVVEPRAIGKLWYSFYEDPNGATGRVAAAPDAIRSARTHPASAARCPLPRAGVWRHPALLAGAPRAGGNAPIRRGLVGSRQCQNQVNGSSAADWTRARMSGPAGIGRTLPRGSVSAGSSQERRPSSSSPGRCGPC